MSDVQTVSLTITHIVTNVLSHYICVYRLGYCYKYIFHDRSFSNSIKSFKELTKQILLIVNAYFVFKKGRHALGQRNCATCCLLTCVPRRHNTQHTQKNRPSRSLSLSIHYYLSSLYIKHANLCKDSDRQNYHA